MKKFEVHWGQVDVAKFLKSEIVRFRSVQDKRGIVGVLKQVRPDDVKYRHYAEAYENLYGILFDKEENKL